MARVSSISLMGKIRLCMEHGIPTHTQVLISNSSVSKAYEGEWARDKATGNGKIFFDNGSVYHGAFGKDF